MRVARRHRLLVRAMTGADENRPRPGVPARANVEAPIADGERALCIDRQLAARLFDHSGRGLPARALDAQLRDDGLRMMRTEVIAVDARVAGGKPLVDRLVNLPQEWLVDDAAPD